MLTGIAGSKIAGEDERMSLVNGVCFRG